MIDLLKRYVHIEDSDATHTMRAKVTGYVLTLGETLQGTTPALLSLLDALPTGLGEGAPGEPCGSPRRCTDVNRMP